MDIFYHLSEVTFFLLTGGMVVWIIAHNPPEQPEVAPAPVYVRESEELFFRTQR